MVPKEMCRHWKASNNSLKIKIADGVYRQIFSCFVHIIRQLFEMGISSVADGFRFVFFGFNSATPLEVAGRSVIKKS